MLDFNRIALQLDAPYIKSNNAPVTRAVWSSSNLPDGLTLSESGLLTGHPSQAGTFKCNVSLATNWGNDSKSINIIIREV